MPEITNVNLSGHGVINMFLAFVFLLKVKLFSKVMTNRIRRWCLLLLENKARRFKLQEYLWKMPLIQQKQIHKSLYESFLQVFLFSWYTSERNHFKAYFRCLFFMEQLCFICSENSQEITPRRCIIHLLQQTKFLRGRVKKNTLSLKEVCYLNFSFCLQVRLFSLCFYEEVQNDFHVFEYVKGNSWCWTPNN